MSRTLTYSGSGKLLAWLEPTGLVNQINTLLLSQGWGVSNVKVYNTPNASQTALSVAVPLAATVPSWNYSISLDMSAPDGDFDNERVLQALRTNLSNWFSDLNISLTYDSNNPVGSFFKQYGTYIMIGVGALVVLPMLMRPQIQQGYQTYRRYAR